MEINNYSPSRKSVQPISYKIAVFSLLALLLTAFSFSGCATLINGTHQTVPIAVTPAGANIQVDGNQYVSPVDASLARDHGYQIVVSKPGYITQTVELNYSFSGWTFLDTIFFVPWVVDLADGSAYKLEPKSVQMTLQPVTVAKAAAPVPAPMGEFTLPSAENPIQVRPLPITEVR